MCMQRLSFNYHKNIPPTALQLTLAVGVASIRTLK